MQEVRFGLDMQRRPHSTTGLPGWSAGLRYTELQAEMLMDALTSLQAEEPVQTIRRDAGERVEVRAESIGVRTISLVRGAVQY